jgi:hypothetical protein
LLGLAQAGIHAYKAWLRTLKNRGGGDSIEEMIHRAVYQGPKRCGVRTKISDLQKDGDEIVRSLFLNNDVAARVCDMSPEAEAEIEAAHHQIQDALRDLKNKQQGEEHPLTIILRARQRLEMLRTPNMSMLTMEELDRGRSVVLFVNFTETITRLFELLDPFVQDEHKSFLTFIHGGQTPEDREYNKKSFLQDKSRVMIVNVQSGGVGLSLGDVIGRFPRSSFISPPWSGNTLKQIIGRIYRAGTKTDCYQRVVYCRGKASVVPKKIADDAIVVGPGEIGRAADHPELREKIETKLGSDATVLSKEDDERISVEEYMARVLNRKLKTIEWLNNGDDDELYQF